MNEYKALSKETWTNIEVRFTPKTWRFTARDVANQHAAHQRQRLRVERRPHRPEPRLSLLRRLLQGEDDLPQELSIHAARYAHDTITHRGGETDIVPDFQFIRPLYHPNIYPNGKLCISILHAPGEDETSGETAMERWNPVQRVETVLLSVLSLLDDAEVSSPANVDAGVMLRGNPEEYKRLVRQDLETSKGDIPKGFVMPTHESAFGKKDEDHDFDMSWEDSDVESFGGSESDVDEMDSDFEGEADDDDDDDEK